MYGSVCDETFTLTSRNTFVGNPTWHFHKPPKSVQFTSLHFVSNIASSHSSSHVIILIPTSALPLHLPGAVSPPASEPPRPLPFTSPGGKPGVCRGIRGNPFTRGSQTEVERSSHRNLLIGRLHLVTHLVTSRHGIPCGGASRVCLVSAGACVLILFFSLFCV